MLMPMAKYCYCLIVAFNSTECNILAIFLTNFIQPEPFRASADSRIAFWRLWIRIWGMLLGVACLAPKNASVSDSLHSIRKWNKNPF